MAFNNDYRGSNRGGNSNYSRPQGQRFDRTPAPLPEIHPESVPADYVDSAETVMRALTQENNRLTTSKIRNLLSLVSDIYNVEKLRTEKELLPESVAKVNMMRVRTAYEAGRDNTVKAFVEKAKLLQYLKGIGTSREALINFAHYMEALVAYHRFFGGKD